MDEGTSKAIPIRRTRSGTRALVVPARRWSLGIGAGVRAVIEPPRQVWLAGLGGVALGARGVHALWSQLVAEGTAVEQRVLGALRRAPTG